MRSNLNNEPVIPSHRQTRQRRLLLDIMGETRGHIDAKELFRQAVSQDSSISPATVYRSLNLFKELGLVDEKHLGHTHCYYELKRSVPHQHLVCKRCGNVIDFICPISEVVEKVKKEHQFIVTKAEIYLEGCCEECAAQEDN